MVFDQAPFIRQSVDDLTTEGLLGLLFAVLVILGFLLSVRATLVTAVSIPLSVLIAMTVLYLGGYTLNILTLGALTVAIGRVVDDSIVVIENIKRHIGYGGPRHAAIVAAVREVAGAITASTVTTVAVFAPIGLVGGQVGVLFRPFAVAVTAALLGSLLVSLTVVPALASTVLRSPATPPPRPAAGDGGASPPVRSRLQRGYLPVLVAALRRPVVSLVVAVVILFGTLALAPSCGRTSSATRVATRCRSARNWRPAPRCRRPTRRRSGSKEFSPLPRASRTTRSPSGRWARPGSDRPTWRAAPPGSPSPSTPVRTPPPSRTTCAAGSPDWAAPTRSGP